MSRQEALSLVVKTLRRVQELSGREWRDLDLNAKPIGALEGFDSLSAIETTVLIEGELKCEFDGDSLFVSADGTRALTLQDIAARLSKRLNARGENK